MINTEDSVKSRIILPAEEMNRKGKSFSIMPQKCRITFGCSPRNFPLVGEVQWSIK